MVTSAASSLPRRDSLRVWGKDGVELAARGDAELRDEPGVGKSALLDHVSRQAAGCRIARVAGM